MNNDDQDDGTIQLVAERLDVGKREIETDHVRVRTVTDEREVVVAESIEHGVLDVQRVVVDREVAEAPAARQEGDLTIIPLVEERLVKRLFVTEELHIRRSTTTETVSLPVTLRSTRAVIERDGETINTGNI